MDRTVRGMRQYWDDAARKNAPWYVDTSMDYDQPDMDEFFSAGRRIVGICVQQSPTPLPGRDLGVEIGAGLGRNCLALAEHVDRVIGIDISPEMVRQAEKLVTDSRVSFRIGDGHELNGVSDGCADVVISFTVFQHIPDERVIFGYLAEAGRVLKPGGVLAFQWNNEAGAAWWKVRRRVLATLQTTGIRAERHGRNAAEFLGSRVPLRRIRAALDGAGLELTGAESLRTLYAFAWARKR